MVGKGSGVWHVKVDALKIREIARKLGVSERTVEEYLLDRLTMQADEDAPCATVPTEADRPGMVDRLGRPLESEAG
jgi:(2Fe-2S) ferredoxin